MNLLRKPWTNDSRRARGKNESGVARDWDSIERRGTFKDLAARRRAQHGT
jgi:hypothetical protein